MEVRLIKPEEEVDYLKISSASFIWKFDKDVDTGCEMPVLGAFDDGKLVAGVELFDFKCNYCGNLIDILVLSGVCSKPECRGMGAVRAIFDDVGKNAVKNNVTAGFLSPFSIEYYEKFGYANLNNIFTIRVPFRNLTHIPHDNNVCLYDGTQLREICELHNKCALTENLMTLREDKKHFCDTPLENADYTYIHRDSNGKADGYVRFSVKRPDELIAEELFVLTPEALNGIIGFLRNYDGIVKTLCVKKQYTGSPFACLADRINDVKYINEGGYAARIYDLKKLLENNVYPDNHGFFSILSLDSFEQNKGIFDVEYQNGKAVVTRRTEGDYDISLTPPAAARLLLAGVGHTADTAKYINGVSLNNNAEDFFRAFPHRVTRFYDSFWSI
ncbi:MAG: GNAT family N-acetyltransferase [Clostridia bacterium]|nr:GNAT family N-acetyltransferase [Clostridia bacterium]